MTGMIKRIFSVVLAVAMFLTITVCVVAAEDGVQSRPQVRFTVGETDENGIFTAKLSIHNATFLGMQFGITFDEDVIAVVDAEGNPTDRFDDAVTCYPFQTDDSSFNFMLVNKVLSNEQGLIQLASIMAQSRGEFLLADEEGFVAYEIRFKELADGDYGFDLADYPYGSYEKEAIISKDGAYVSLDFAFVCPNGKTYEFDRENKESEEVEPPVQEDEDSSSDGKGNSGSSGGGSSGGGSSGNKGNGTASKADALREARKAGTIVLQIGTHKVSVNGVLKWVDKDNKNVVSYIENDRTMVPLRFISETLGAKVEWVAETRTVNILMDTTRISMQIDNQSYTINDAGKEMDAAPVIREDRTFVPLRFVTEALGKSVYWNAAMRVVVIAPADKPWDDTDSVTQQLMADTIMMFQWFDEEAYQN